MSMLTKEEIALLGSLTDSELDHWLLTAVPIESWEAIHREVRGTAANGNGNGGAVTAVAGADDGGSFVSSIAKLASALDRSERRVASYMTMGLKAACHIEGQGYNVQAAQEWMAANIANVAEDGLHAEKRQAEIDKLREDIRAKKLRNDERAGRLKDIAVVEQFLAECFLRAKTRMEEWPERIAAEMPADIREQVRELAEAVLHQLLIEMSNMEMEE